MPTTAQAFQVNSYQASSPTSDVDVYLSRDDLRAQVGVNTGFDDRLDRAVVMGTMYARKFCDGMTVAETPVLEPGPLDLTVVATTPGRVQGATIAAVRFWQSGSVPFGIAGGLGELAVRVSGRSIPEADLAMQYEREAFGVA